MNKFVWPYSVVVTHFSAVMNFLTPQDDKQSYFWGGEMAATRYD